MPDKPGYIKLSQEPVEDAQSSVCREIWSIRKKAVFKKILVVLAVLQLLGIWSLYKRSNAYSSHSPNTSPLDAEDFNGFNNVSQIFHLPLTQAKDMGKFYAELNMKNLWCFTLGTELSESTSASKCICRKGWNGLDCGVPPSVWNSEFLQQGEREGILIRRRKRPRRLIYSTGFGDSLGFKVLNFTVRYLNSVVEAFVVADFNCSSQTKFVSKLGSLNSNKIVWLCLSGLPGESVESMQRKIWTVAKKKLSDFRTDDIIVMSNPTSVPSLESLSFLKLYNGFSEPINFNLLSANDISSLRNSNSTSRNGSNTVGSISSITACTLEFIRYVCRYEANLVWFATDEYLKKRVQRFEKNNWPVKSWVMGSASYPAGWDCSSCAMRLTYDPTTRQPNDTLPSPISTS